MKENVHKQIKQNKTREKNDATQVAKNSDQHIYVDTPGAILVS